MIKRPLAMSAVVFVIVLAFLSLWNDSVFSRNPVKSDASGKDRIEGFLQDDVIRVYGVVSDYDYNEQYGQTTTELILSDVHILLSNNTKEKTDQILNPASGSEVNSDRWKKITRVGQNIVLYINKEETLSIGETVLLSGRLSFFDSATNPGQFDAKKYYKNKDTLFAVKKAVIERRVEGDSSLRQKLKSFGKKQEEKLEYFLSDAYASILKAMLLGNKKELDPETKELYQDNGIAHILAISALHISLLGMSLYRLLRRLPLPGWVPLFGSEIFLLLYGCMVGFSASAFRAIGMFTFFLLSKITKRSYDLITALAFTAIVQLMIHPGYLFDCSFQLSYGAILGMGILLPAFQELVKEIKPFRLQKLVSYVLPSLSVTLMTTPILIYHYHEISFFSILLNVVVIPFVGALLLIGIAMLLLAEIWIPAAWLCTWPINGILLFYEYSCRFLELFPIGQKNISHPSWAVIFLYYSLLFAMTVLVKKKKRLYQFLFPAVAAVLLLFPKNPGFSVWMLDVGQGDSSVIFSEEGNCFVIDCGSTSEYNVGEKRLIPFLKYHGVGKVDAVFITHADADHMNGVMELLECGRDENVEVSRVVVYEKALETEPEKWTELITVAEAEGIPIIGMGQGDRTQTESLTLTCLYPLKEQTGLTGNASSLVLELEADVDSGMWRSGLQEDGVFRALFTGDLEIAGEQLLLEEYDAVSSKTGQYDVTLAGAAQYDLLKVGHHGSSGSSSAAFLEWASPGYALISCGEDNVYGHPHTETLNRLAAADCTVVTTPEAGAICVRKESGDLKLRIYTWR